MSRPVRPEALKVMVSALAIRRVSDPVETAAVNTFLARPAASVGHERERVTPTAS
jgi:hypothetical protein